jgi:ATP-dependent Zn protease
MYATNVAAQMVGACGMTGTLVSYAAVQSGALAGTNLVGQVLGDGQGRAAVEELLQAQKVAVGGLLETHRHLVEALRDALLARHELVGDQITDVLEAAARLAPPRRGSLTGESAPSTSALAAPEVIDLRGPGNVIREA